MKVWNSNFRFALVWMIISLSKISSQSFKEKLLADGMGELLTANGKISISGDKNSLEKTDRVVFEDSEIEIGLESFAHFYFRTGMYVKSRGQSKFSVRKLKAMSVISFRLLDGELAFTIPHISKDSSIGDWEVEVVTPLGTVTLSQGDVFVSFSAKNQLLRIYNTDGKALFSLDSIQMSLVPGEKVVVNNNKVSPKTDISGSENRMLFSWYRQGGPWRVPSYLNQFSQLADEKPAVLKNIRINGLERNEFIDHQTFSPSDLILGRLRIEGDIANKLPHQVLQISLNNGRDYYDIASHENFVWKVRPEEKHYQLRFRLRDLERFYEVIHEDINFYYQRKGNQQLISEWIGQLQKFYHYKDALKLSELFSDCKTFPRSLREDLSREFTRSSFQRLYLTVLRYREYSDKLIVNLKFRSVITLLTNGEPIKKQGRFQAIFTKDSKWGFKVKHLTGTLPFLNSFTNSRADRIGPTVFGPSVVQLPSFGNTTLSVRIEDDLSKIKSIEYFIDKIGRDGKGRKILARDGKFDERVEDGQIVLGANMSGIRLFLHAQDQSGNWGDFFSVTIAR